MSRKTGNAQSHATYFRHSAVLSLPAVLLRKVSNVNQMELRRCEREISPSRGKETRIVGLS